MLASTSEVYGDPLEHPQRETYWGNVNPIGPRGVYDEAKRFAEAMSDGLSPLPRARREDRPHLQHVRPADAASTTAAPCRTSSLRRCAARTSRFSAAAAQTRSFCYVTDLVAGILRLMEAPSNEPVNIGNPHEMSIEADGAADHPDDRLTSQVVFRPLPTDDPKVRQPDITRARTLLGWEPKVALEEGLTSTIEYFRQKMQV